MSYREASEDSWDNGKRKTEILAAQQTEKAANPEGSGTKGLCKGCIPKKRTLNILDDFDFIERSFKFYEIGRAHV